MNTYTDSALANMITDAFAICRTEEFPGCGSYYYNEIKVAKFEQRPVIVRAVDLEAVQEIMGGRTVQEKKNLITKALREFAQRNIPLTEAQILYKDMRWKIE